VKPKKAKQDSDGCLTSEHLDPAIPEVTSSSFKLHESMGFPFCLSKFACVSILQIFQVWLI
jgi:hypothetical protein